MMLLHDASNCSSYSFKLETCLRSENMDEVVDVAISNPSNPDDNIVVNPMTDEKHGNAMANLTEEKHEELNPPSGNAAERKKQQKLMRKGLGMITRSLHDNWMCLVRQSYPHPAMHLAKICEEFEPTDVVNATTPCEKLRTMDPRDCDDFSKHHSQ